MKKGQVHPLQLFKFMMSLVSEKYFMEQFIKNKDHCLLYFTIQCISEGKIDSIGKIAHLMTRNYTVRNME